MNEFEINILVEIWKELAKGKPDLLALDLLYGELYQVSGGGASAEELIALGGVEVKTPEA